MDEREMTRWYAVARIAVGVTAVVFPGWATRFMTGDTGRAVRVLARMAGIRDIVLGLGCYAALQEEKRPVRPWVTLAAVADAGDALATLVSYRNLPRRRRFLALLSGIGGAGTGAYLVSVLEED